MAHLGNFSFYEIAVGIITMDLLLKKKAVEKKGWNLMLKVKCIIIFSLFSSVGSGGHIFYVCWHPPE